MRGGSGLDGPGGPATGTGVEALIARVLLWGGLVSGLLVVLGLTLYAAGGGFSARVLELHRLGRPERLAHPRPTSSSPSAKCSGVCRRAHWIRSR